MSTPAERFPLVHGSRYAAELAKGGGYGHFPDDLEREYRRFYLAERRGHVRSFNAIMCLLFALAVAGTLWAAPDGAPLGPALRLGVIALAYLAMAATAMSRYHERFYLATARWASLGIGVVGAIEVAWRVRSGAGELFALLTAYSIGLYFLAGILYRGAVQANLAMVVALAATLVYLGVPAVKTLELTAILAGTALIGAVAFRNQGLRFRRSFLERGLIGELAARDGLTGLKNRRAFDEHLTRTWQQALRDRRPLVLMMIDVDHFKKFNDRRGHQAGDAALQRIAAVIESFARRPLDLAARYGGEEFAVILFDLAREHVERLAEQVRSRVAGLGIAHPEQDPGVVTVSIGVALVRPTLERSPAGAVQLADEALYAAKSGGRNCVRISETEYQELATGSFRAPRL